MSEKKTVHRIGFGLKEQISDDFSDDYHSNLVNYIISQGNKLHFDTLSIYLTKKFGFCYGVERAIEYSYETVQKFPDRAIYLLGEIVHNPYVNNLLRKMGVKIIDGLKQGEIDFSFLNPKDVVIIPAFGVSHSTLLKLHNQKCEIVDATCGSVLSVWKRVEEYAKSGFTVLIHGKYPHEETNAICSQAAKYPDGKYVVIQDTDEAGLLVGFFEGTVSSEDLMKKIGHKVSKNFNPDRDLRKIGLANQTTMVGSESLEIAKMIQNSMESKFGKNEGSDRFRSFDTICSATQDRQEALRALLDKTGLDLMLIIGGFKSSNTGNLVKIASGRVQTYHIQDQDDLISQTDIRHKPNKKNETVISQNWLPEKKVTIGITAGASTPNSKIEQVLRRLFFLKNVPPSKILQF